MAERRMFSKAVIDSDMFLDMPLSAQALYFHLSMRADDDGFVNNPKKIQRMTSCTDDDLKLLVAKNYIIPFESGIVVIKHWRIHNYIKSDRYKETVYQDEKRMLTIEKNKVYSLGIPNVNQCVSEMEPKCIHEVSEMDTQDRLGKYSIELDKDSIEEEYIYTSKVAPVQPQTIVDMYNRICVSYPKVTKLSESRKKAIRARLKMYSIEEFQKLFEMAEGSSFLKGSNNRNWSASFDWLVKDANMAKVLDGNYSDSTESKPKEPEQQESYLEKWSREIEEAREREGLPKYEYETEGPFK